MPILSGDFFRSWRLRDSTGLQNSKRHALIALDQAHLIGCKESKQGITEGSFQTEVARIALSTLCLPSLVYEWSKANVAKQLIISAMMHGLLPGCCASSLSSVPNALQVACLPILCPSFTLTCFPSNAAGPSSLFQPPISNPLSRTKHIWYSEHGTYY